MSANGSEPAHPAKRKAGRLRLRIPAQVVLPQGTCRVVLCDLSSGGAKVFAKLDMDGRDVLVRWARYEAFGAVVWGRDGFYGVEFDAPVPEAVLVATRHLQDVQGMKQDEINEWMADKGWLFGKAL